MKTTILLLLLFVAANDPRYDEIMAKNITLVYKAQSIEELQQATNVFDRIGDAEKNKWEPFYYSSFGYIMMANREKDPVKKDALLDQAKIAIDKATAIKPNESEIVALEGFISMIRITVDPATRGPKYSGLAMQSFGKAIGLNPENPRAHTLMAQMEFGTAQFFNVPPTDACTTAQKALEKFASYKSDNLLAPVWGKGMTEEMVKNCK